MICLDNAKRRMMIPVEHAARIQEDRICLESVKIRGRVMICHDSMTIREARYDLS